MDIRQYLERIGYQYSLEPPAETLKRLQIAHLRTVPFENLSIHAHQPIVLNDELLFEKIVTGGRGGFCYELNGLFSWLLRSLGFEVGMLSAQVANAEGDFSVDFDHLCLLVTVDQRLLVDVGFGDSFIEPLFIDQSDVQIQGERAYRIDRVGDYLVSMQRVDKDKDEWKPQYRFKLRTYQYADFELRCRYHQTSPNSHFTQKRICSRLTPTGRISLSDMRFIVSENGVRRERPVKNPLEYAQLLQQHFGIVM